MLQPNEFKIYNASAGAGKTYTLVKEYLSILLSSPNPHSFESILAITFTNKAANEMKERILQQLVRFSQPGFAENKDLLLLSAELSLSPEILHQRSKETLTKILHNYSRFSVSTIDKFNLRLMKSFAQDLGLSSNFNVEMELDTLLEDSVNQLFSKIGEDETLTSVLIEIALDNLNENRSWDISRELIQNAKTLYSDSHLVKLSKLQQFNLEEFNQFRKTVYRNVSTQKNKLISIGKKAFEILGNHQLSVDDFSYGNSGFIGFFNKLQNEVFEFPGSRHIAFKENTNPEKWCSGKASPAMQNAVEQVSPELISLSDEALEILRDLAVWQGIQRTITSLSIINEVEKSIETIKEDNNVLLISEFNKLISTNLQKQPSGFIYERIGNRFHHYFIDEFQDTSTLQWQNLLPLVENARAGSDTVMLVGDAKQSIYRWRGGNPEQMVYLIQNKEPLDISVENLPKNWRSHQNIIEFNNGFYSQIAENLPVEDYKNLYSDGNQQLSNHKEGGYVQLNFIPKKKDEVEGYNYSEAVLGQLLVNLNSALEQGFRLGEMAILHRTKAEGKIIAEFLSEKNIPIISSESLLLANSHDIQIIELFFKTISNEEDKVSKAQFLIRLNELKNHPFGDITEKIQSVLNKNLFALKEFLAEIDIDISFAFSPSVSLFDFTEKTIKAFHLGESETAYLQYFLDFILEYSMQNEYNLQRFLEYWEIQKEKLSISSPEGVNAVQLMTIHKSKGLEFPVVVIPFADWGDRMKVDKFWIPVQKEELPFEEFIVDSFGNLENVSDEIKEIIDNERNEFLLDNLNLLYVATTRAVEQLYISAPKDVKSGIGVYFNEQFKGENEIVLKGEKGRNSKAKESETSSEILPFVVENWENRIQISKESSKRWKKKKEIVYGDLVHGLMEFIYTEKDVNPVLQSALNSGEISQGEISEMKKRMLEILRHPELNAYFSEDYKILNERDFIDESGKIFRPDRLVIDENRCTIIDYKTGSEKPEHIQQMNEYATHLEKMNYVIEKKLIVYIGEGIEVKEVG